MLGCGGVFEVTSGERKTYDDDDVEDDDEDDEGEGDHDDEDEDGDACSPPRFLRRGFRS